jgi:hypothetical protein
MLRRMSVHISMQFNLCLYEKHCPPCTTSHSQTLKGGYTPVTLSRTVNTVLWQCGQDSWPCHVLKVGYAVTLWACSVRCRYLAIASKGWYGYCLSRSGRALWHITTVHSSRLLYIHDASGSHNKLGTPCCNTRRILLRHEARDESSDRNSMSCQSLATLQVCTFTLNFIQTAQQKWDAQVQIHLNCGHHGTNLHKTHNTQIFADTSCAKVYSQWIKNVQNTGKKF